MGLEITDKSKFLFQWLFWAWDKYDEVEVLNYRSVPTLPRTARKQRPYYFM